VSRSQFCSNRTAPEKGAGFNEHERPVVIASASSLVDDYVRDGCDNSKCVFTRLGAHQGRAATRGEQRGNEVRDQALAVWHEELVAA